MIRINLLKSFTMATSGGSQGYSDSSQRDQVLKGVLMRAIILAIGPLALYFYEGAIIPELNTRLEAANKSVTEAQQFINSKKGLADEIKKYEEEQSKFNAQMSFINKISKDKVNEFKLFQHLQASTPESVWINNLEFKDNELILEVESDVSTDLSTFLERLSNAEFLTNIIPIKQDSKPDPFGVGISTTTMHLKAQFQDIGSAK